MKRLLLSGAAVAAALALAAPAQALTYFSGSVTAASPSGLTPVTDFTAAAGAKVLITVTDCCTAGDYYATYVDSTLVGTTPFVPEFGSVLSSGSFVATLGAGTTHDFQLMDLTDFLLPAGAFVTITSDVPEPATWALMLTGVFGLGAALRSRRSRDPRLADQLT